MPYEDRQASPQKFFVCHGFTCTSRTDVSLTEKDWKSILAVFKPAAKNAAGERKQIARAIARIEEKVTQVTGLNPDRAKAENFEKDQHQMDCIDETINTDRYLKFLAAEGVFKFHTVGEPIHRGFMIDGLWPHNSATVKETETGDVYAIDSYYFDSGKAPAIVPFEDWMNDWRPEGSDD